MSTEQLKDEFQYFLDNKEELYKTYPNKIIVIKNKQVVGTYDDASVAYEEASRDNEPGTYLIQSLKLEDKNQQQVFHSRVII